MKKIIFLLSVLCLIKVSAYSQILKPVTWSYAAKKTGPNTATVFIKANIDQGWHLYSQFVKEGGPVKTTFTFPPSLAYVLIGSTAEPKAVSKYESTFKMNVSYFERSAIFQQKLKLKGKSATVKGSIEFMVCNDKQCLPPEQIDFSILVN